MTAAAFVAHVWSFTLQSATVLAAAALVGRFGRRWPAAMRLRLMQGAMACALAAPLILMLTRAAGDPAVTPLSGSLAMVSSVASAKALSTLPGVSALIASAIVVAIVSRLAWLTMGHRRLRRGSAIDMGPEVGREIDGQQRALGTQARIEFRADVIAPSTFGRRPAVVLLPVSLAAADPVTRQAVVLHELLHVRRGDWSAVVAEELLRAVFWFHPGVHWAIAEMRLAREQIVDRAVVAATGARRAYLEVLLSYGATPPVATVAASPFFWRRQLERRIKHLTEETTMTGRQGFLVAASVVMLGGAVAAADVMFPMAGDSGVSATPNDAQQTGSDTIEKTLPKVIHEVAAVYPEDAKAAKVQGTVVVDVTVDVDGRVTATKVTQSIAMLDAAAEEALRQWIFEPGKVNGQPVKVTVAIEVRFSLK